MVNYVFHISYKGTNFRGWQRQKNAFGIQEAIENCLGKVFKQKVIILGCGRTDAEVHALQYFFHINIEKEIGNEFIETINRNLPKDIVLHDIIRNNKNYHAQFDATERTYDYFFHTIKNPFLAEQSSFYPLQDLNLVKLKEASKVLLNYSDFKAFCKTPDRHDTTMCNVKLVKLFKAKDSVGYRIQITADRFLKSMMRIVVYNLLEVGQGKIEIKDFEKYLKSNAAPEFINLAYPQGLYLSKIKYPFLDIEPKVDLFPLFNKRDWEEI